MTVSRSDNEVCAPATRQPSRSDRLPGHASFVALLEKLGCSLVITNYQSSTVMTFSGLGDGRPGADVCAVSGGDGAGIVGRSAGGCNRRRVIVLTNVRKLAPSLPRLPGFFDGYFVPRCALHDRRMCAP